MLKSQKISDFLGLQRSTVGMLCMVILVGMGERMAERFLPIYLIALGAGPIVIGLLNALDNLLSAIYAFPGGYLFRIQWCIIILCAHKGAPCFGSIGGSAELFRSFIHNP